MAQSKPPIIRDNTAEEEAEIQAQIAADPDTWETPLNATVRRRGRPSGSNKTQVTVKLDNDVIAALKSPQSKGWQTRLNSALRDSLNLGDASK